MYRVRSHPPFRTCIHIAFEAISCTGQLHGYDNSTGADPKLIPLDENGFPSQCDLEGIPLLDCISQILCPLYIQCEFCGEEHPDLFRVKASGDTDTGSFEIVRDYKTPEQRRKEEVVYDNFGYSLVDGMVLKATGFPLIHWIREVVLRPLNMAQSLRLVRWVSQIYIYIYIYCRA